MYYQKSLFHTLMQFLMVIMGNVLYALTVKFFLLPSNLPAGGTTGLALIANHFFNIPISVFILFFNVAMFFLGWKVFGRKFALSTIISTFSYPFFLSALDFLFPDVILTQNLFLCTVFSGLGIGVALGIVLRAGASTGGMDIPPLVLHHYLHIPVSGAMYTFDCLILLLQAAQNEIDYLLYGILLVITYTIVLDKLLLLGSTRTEIKIISSNTEEIRLAILHEIDRGVTLLSAEGGYNRQKSSLILSVISNRELPRVEKLVHSIDPECFVIVSRVSEVKGRGFTIGKKYHEKASENRL